jgi:EmrB/QacA subfamily drug resistance transporter
LGDRFGRRRVFVIGLGIFTIGSALAALAPTSTALILARAIQGLGGAIVTPLTLTILSAGVPAARRPLALGAWGGIGGLAIAIGPVVGGAITQGLDWHWIFWLNVPIGIVAMFLAWFRLEETHGPEGRLDVVGLALASAGLLGVVYGVIHGNDLGWTDTQVLGAIVGGAVLLVGFVLWELRAKSPMLPPHLFRSRGFTAANVASLLMYFGMFGSIFLLSQYFQIVLGLTPFEAGLRVLPWTAMPIFVAPIAGVLSGRIGARPIVVGGLVLMSIGLGWMAAIASPTTDYSAFILPFIVSGAGMGMFFAPIANVVLSAVKLEEEGKASGANNAIREIGGVFGVAVLASVFTANGSYTTPQAYVDGLVPAMWVGAVIVAISAVAGLFIPSHVRGEQVHGAEEPTPITDAETAATAS